MCLKSKKKKRKRKNWFIYKKRKIRCQRSAPDASWTISWYIRVHSGWIWMNSDAAGKSLRNADSGSAAV